MAVTVEKLADPLLAEVRGIEPSKPIAEAEAKAVYDAFLEHKVLVFRDALMEAGQVVDFARIFGDLEPHITKKYWHPDYNELIVMSNVGPDGKIKALDSKRGVGWHTDMCYMRAPSKATLLHTVQIPDVGGDTLFANMTMACETMPQSLKAKLEGLKATFRYGGKAHPEDRERLTEEDKQRPPEAHPILRPHPDTGEVSIYVNPYHVWGVEGMEDEEAWPLLEEVFEWCGQERFQARHVWRLGDTVIWDNRCTWHAGTGDNPKLQPRVFYRATVRGTPTQ